jgi:hypothetical protein
LSDAAYALKDEELLRSAKGRWTSRGWTKFACSASPNDWVNSSFKLRSAESRDNRDASAHWRHAGVILNRLIAVNRPLCIAYDMSVSLL